MPRLAAVIDIGSTSIRMQIGEINVKGRIRKLESFAQAVSVGKDSFHQGKVSKQTIEDCVFVLRIYRAKLDEYGIVSNDDIRVIATSGVKEASNRLAMQDRIFIATGFEIEPFDAAELHRATYLGIQPFMNDHPDIFSGRTIACEVGGGSTEVLVLAKMNVSYSRTFRLGALRMRKSVDSMDLLADRAKKLMVSQIDQSVETLLENIGGNVDVYVAMGGDIRFAAHEIKHKQLDEHLTEIKTKNLEAFVDSVLELSPDKIVNQYHFSLPDAESFAPGLLTHLHIAKCVGAKRFVVADVNLRDSLLKEMAMGRRWTREIQEQIVGSAKQLGKKFNYNQSHAKHVAFLACELFDQLKELHHLGNRFRGILELASLLHEIGLFVSTRSNHKHAMYLIRNSELFGVGQKEMDLVALVARYHRRATPQPSHEIFARLPRSERVAVAKLAALLRLAIALNASHGQKIKQIECQLNEKRVLVLTDSVADLSMEQLKLKQVRSFFESIFGTVVVLQQRD